MKKLPAQTVDIIAIQDEEGTVSWRLSDFTGVQDRSDGNLRDDDVILIAGELLSDLGYQYPHVGDTVIIGDYKLRVIGLPDGWLLAYRLVYADSKTYPKEDYQ